MCEGCYRDYGSPKPDDAARAVVPLIDAVYDDGGVGGGLHVVVDDWNLEDEHLIWCLGQGLSEDERQCAEALLALSLEQRAAALAIYDGFA
jgi:hypothetical protein